MAKNNNGVTLHEVEELRDENLKLKEQIKHFGEELQSSNDIANALLVMNDSLRKRNTELVLNNNWLCQRIDELKGKQCNKNCVACTMLWICKTEKLGLGVDLCIRQLEKIIMAYAGEKIEQDDLKCERFMEILKKCELVSIAMEYKYPTELNAKERMINEAWHSLMTIDGSVRVMILGRVISVANDEGHVEICDLDTRTSDGKVIIHNPQKENWGHGNQDDFRNYVIKDEGLILYRVDLEKLKQIIIKHEPILHLTGQSNQTLVLPAVAAIDWVPEN